MPSSVLVGGIRMSVTTTSGRSLSTAASSEGRSPHDATTRISGSAGQDLPDALADDQAVIGQRDGNGHTQPSIARRKAARIRRMARNGETSAAGIGRDI